MFVAAPWCAQQPSLRCMGDGVECKRIRVGYNCGMMGYTYRDAHHIGMVVANKVKKWDETVLTKIR